jgi:hypothetical protein
VGALRQRGYRSGGMGLARTPAVASQDAAGRTPKQGSKRRGSSAGPCSACGLGIRPLSGVKDGSCFGARTIRNALEKCDADFSIVLSDREGR